MTTKPDPAASALARKRWAGTTKEQRREATRAATAASPRTKKRTDRRYQTRSVLAGAYRDSSPKSLLTHLCDVTESDANCTAVCKRVADDHLVDMHGMAADALHACPTCPTCAKRWSKIRSPENT